MEKSRISFMKHPYPYRAALTVASDTHTTPVETFEAVHTLINTRNRIKRGSDVWERLFIDSEITQNENWREGINGFGLPIADSMWLFAHRIGVFASFDEDTGQPVPHEYNGRDLRNIIDNWLRLGWVDTLHTPGYGHVPRKATAAGLKWLQSRPHGHLKVFSNHTLHDTPTNVAPDRPAFSFILKNYIKYCTLPLCWMGMKSLAQKVSRTPRWSNPYPHPFPNGQKGMFFFLGILLAVSLVLLFVCLGYQVKMFFIMDSILIASIILLLYFIPVRFEQGDNPNSPYYHKDLTNQFGFRYFWMIRSLPNYDTLVPETLVLPELSVGGRPSCLRVVRLDDGSKCITFGRCYKQSLNAYGSLELFTEDELENLCKRQGTSIIYTHWADNPKKVFTVKALEGLSILSKYFENGKIWVAPTSEVLHFTFIRAYLNYNVSWMNGRHVINIIGVNNPVGDTFVPTYEDLRGISFDCPANEPVEMLLDGKPISENTVKIFNEDNRKIIMFKLKARNSGSSTSYAS